MIATIAFTFSTLWTFLIVAENRRVKALTATPFRSLYAPGVTDADIDERFGDDMCECSVCGKVAHENQVDNEASEGFEHVCKTCADEQRAEEGEAC